MANYKKLWQEFVKDSKKVDLTSFELKDHLHSDFWDDNNILKENISKQLIVIVDDFLQNVGLEGLEYEDITFTGSLANFNWSKFSDIDLHLLVDFSKVDENTDLVREFFRGKYGIWNKDHDIRIKGFEVEIYVQDSNEAHISTGVYSVLNDEWIVQPVQEEPEIDFENIQMKADKLMCLIDCAKDMYYKQKYEDAHQFAIKIKQKIKKFRQCGLERAGQYSSENLAFKVLRRNGYLGHLSDLVSNSYDRMMSMSEDFNKKMRNFVENSQNKLEEEEPFQKMVKKKHSKMKNRLIGTKGKHNKRSKSAPPLG